MQDTGTKLHCGKCGVTKAETEFSKNARRKNGHNYWCKACMASWQRADPKGVKRRQQKYRTTHKGRLSDQRREKVYGVDGPAYQEMLEAQYNVCAICYRPNAGGKPLFVDHCHATGAVRALLCSHCNWAIGHMQDNSDRLRSAAAYLDRHRSAD